MYSMILLKLGSIGLDPHWNVELDA